MDFLSAEALKKTTVITKEFSEAIVNSVVFPIEKKIPKNMRKELGNYFNKESNYNIFC
jgi:aminopeptidase YwaD